MLHPTRARYPSALVLALVALLAFGGSGALAASTSAGVSESFTVAASVTVANVPSTGVFSTPTHCSSVNVPFCVNIPAGSTDYSYNFVSTIGTNNGSGLSVAVLATTLTAGSSTIPLSARCILWNVPAGFSTATQADSGHCGALDPTTPFTLGSTSAQGSVQLAVEPLLRLDPSSLPAGSYGGTLTVRATTNP